MLYPWHIIILAAFCAVVTLLIVWLLIQRSRHGRAKASLRTSEERYFLALAGSTDGLWDWDLLSDSVFFSDRFREILGYSPEEFPGTIDSFRSRLHPEDAEAIWAAIERHLQDRVPYRVEYRLQTKSGDYRWFLAGGQAIWNTEGKAIQMSGSIQDITERKQAELNLKAALSEIKELKEKLEVERAYLQEEIKSQYNHENIIGQSNALNYIFYKVEQIAPTDTTVLILGETGTGKELVARALHHLSRRKDRALVKVNCATPEIFNTDQGAQFTSNAFTNVLKHHDIKLSMDGRGRVQDNIFIERLWWTVKHHYLYLHVFENGTQLRNGLNEWFRFYNQERFHQALDNLTPDEVYYDLPHPFAEAA